MLQYSELGLGVHCGTLPIVGEVGVNRIAISLESNYPEELSCVTNS